VIVIPEPGAALAVTAPGPITSHAAAFSWRLARRHRICRARLHRQGALIAISEPPTAILPAPRSPSQIMASPKP